MQSKKGITLGESFGTVLSLVLIALLVIVAIFLFGTISTSFADTNTATVLNESTLMKGPVVSALSNSTYCQFHELSIVQVKNASGTEITSGNYSVNSTGIANLSVASGTPWNVSYAYKWGSQACTSSNAFTTQFGTYPTLIGLVGTIIFLALVIGVLVGAFRFNGRA